MLNINLFNINLKTYEPKNLLQSYDEFLICMFNYLSMPSEYLPMR